MITSKSKILLSLFLLLGSHLFAAHIVGGSITYECLGPSGNGVRYRFTMKVYRDCAGNGAQFDNPANIAVYAGSNENNFLYDDYTVPLQDIIPININEPDCISNLPNLCIEEGNYTWERVLPKSNESYFIVYQRCCRTAALTNITFPNETGATYYIEITPQAQNQCNNSPVFNSLPPTVVCNHYPMEVDFSATDADGDQLVYHFCAAYGGGGPILNPPGLYTCDGAVPTPPCGPPFSEVGYQIPVYSAGQPMGGNPVVDINAQTGIISGTPQLNGVYVVCVCVEEYRNGQLLSVTRREFQFAVTDCAPLVSAQVSHDVLTGPGEYLITRCDGTKTVTIKNLSVPASNIQTVNWHFNLNNGNVINSTQKDSLTVNFPNFGTYHGFMAVNAGQDCGDTAFVTVELYPPAHLDLGPDFKICQDSTIILNAGDEFASYQWQNGTVGQTFTATTTGTYYVAATDHCGKVFRDTVQVTLGAAPPIQLNDVSICPGKSVQISLPSGFAQYNWTPSAGLSCTNCASVTAQPSSTTTYTVAAATQSGCTASESVTVTVLPTPMRTYVIQFYPNQSVTIGGVTYTQPTTVTIPVPSTTGGCDSLNTYILELIPTTLSLICPANMTVALPNNSGTTAVTFDPPVLVTDCPDPAPVLTLISGQASGSQFGGGLHTVCYSGTDNCGNADTCCFTIRVTSLDLVCPPNMTVALPANANVVPVDYPFPTVTTDCPDGSPDVQLSQGQVSGGNFQPGVNTVCFRATNECGNQDECCFTIRVTSLDLVCPPNMTVALPDNASGVPVNYPFPTATTDCPNGNPDVQLSQGQVSGGNFAPGLNTVCFKATTTCGNQDECCFTVFVASLNLQCPPDMTVALPNNASTVTVNYAAPVATTDCPGGVSQLQITQGLPSGSGFSSGLHKVCYAAATNCGNQDNCCFNIRVTSLDFHCPQNQTVQLPVAATTVPVNYADPTITSDCPTPGSTLTLLQGQASGSGFALGAHQVCYEGSNACGNHDTCCFTVTVLDAPPPCDIKVIGCMKFELLDIRLDSINQRRFRIRVTNFCNPELDYVASELPPGIVAVTPQEGSIYTAPNTGNTYKVRNPNASPFYSVRYRSINSGINNGEFDVIEHRLPQQSHHNSYIHMFGRLKDGQGFEAYLNTFYCPVQPWAGNKDAGERTLPELSENEELNLRPNPSSGMVMVDVEAWKGQSLQVRIFDAQGREVLSEGYQITDEWLALDLDGSVSDGLYYLTVQPENGRIATASFVLSR